MMFKSKKRPFDVERGETWLNDSNMLLGICFLFF